MRMSVFTSFHCCDALANYSCDKCDYQTDLKTSLKTHKIKNCDISKSQKLEGEKCKECGTFIYSILSWFLHWKRSCKTFQILQRQSNHRTIQKWFGCNQCEYKSKSSGDVKEHFSLEHSVGIAYLEDHNYFNKHPTEDDIHWFSCTQCKYKSKIKSDLQRHLLQCHSVDRQVFYMESHIEKCTANEIDKVFLGGEKLENKQFECEECLYKTKYKNSLKQHIIRKHTKCDWFKCSKCGYKTKFDKDLATHDALKHSSHKPVIDGRWFQCRLCNYKTKLYHAFKSHYLYQHASQENIRWLNCNQCDFQTKEISALASHFKHKHTITVGQHVSMVQM